MQNETLEVIRSLVSDGLFRLGKETVLGEHLGGVATEGERFVAWNQSLDHALHKISHVYVKHYDDPEKWMYTAFCNSPTKASSSHDPLNATTSSPTEASNDGGEAAARRFPRGRLAVHTVRPL